MSEAPPGQNWEFDGFTMLPEMRLLLKGGVAVPLTPKAFDTLGILIANRDRVVSKDELLRSVWPDVVVEEGNLTQQIFLLRKALGENAQQSRYIVTVPGHGYRFTARVKATSGGAPSPPVAAIGGRRSIPIGYLAIGGVAILAIVLGAAWRARDRGSPPMDLAKARITKITESGKATASAASADGRYVAYVEDDGDQHSLWVRTATGGRTQVVPPQAAVLAHLTFSPDGEHLYFARASRTLGVFVLSRIPSGGGVESPVLYDVDTPISFSPDGREFAFTRRTEEDGFHVVIAAAGGEPQRILAKLESPMSFALVGPDWSPDGKIVAASAIEHRSTGPRSYILLLPVDRSARSELHSTESLIGRIRWLPDGSGVLAAISETLTRQFPIWHSERFRFSGGPIWRIGFPGGRAEQLTSDLVDHDLCCLDFAVNGTEASEVTSVNNSLVSDLWIAPADNLDDLKQVTGGGPTLSRHAWLPDNDTIVYRDLGGRLNGVYKDKRTFTLSLPAGLKVAGGVSACGKGPYVVFQGVPGNNIYRIPATGGAAVKLTKGSFDSNPACSPDGKWVMYSVSRLPYPSVWRVPIEGGDPTRLAPDESYDALPSPSGRRMYYSGSHWEEHPVRTRSGEWVFKSLPDLETVWTVPSPLNITFGVPAVWAPDDSGLDFVVTTMGVSNIWRQLLTGGQPVQITHYKSGKIFSFAWSPDGRWLSIAMGANRSDVVTLSR